MTYHIVHKTKYKYKHPVSFGNHVTYLTPRSKPNQTCTSHELLVKPEPVALGERRDYFGNSVTFFTIQEPHGELNIEARSRVVIEGPPVLWPRHSLPWEEVVDSLRVDLSPEGLNAYEFVFESARVKPGAQFAAYALQSF